ncbi:MAG: hypothetical protein R2991_11705 [Thermoanaerobaculia bacterium]
MKLVDGRYRLAATDLANHLSCRHLTQLRLAVERGERERPAWVDPRTEVLRERAASSTRRGTCACSRSRGARSCGSAGEGKEEPGDLVARTEAAMRRGDAVIVQGALEAELDGELWYGRPDLLQRVEVPGGTALGGWGYEAVTPAGAGDEGDDAAAAGALLGAHREGPGEGAGSDARRAAGGGAGGGVL